VAGQPAAWAPESRRPARPTGSRADRRRHRAPPRGGLPLTAFVQMRGRLDHCLPKTSKASDYPEVVEVHKLSGDHCSMLKVRGASMEHFEGLLERLGRHGEMRTSVVLSTQYEGRPVKAPPEDFLRASHSQGWR
jgi:Lrp/AsnC family transcriptional regulator, leucine-responsive regulatory protein